MTDWWASAPIVAPRSSPEEWWASAPLAQPAEPAETDPVRLAVRAEMEAQRAQGLERGAGSARRFLQGATFGLADEALAAAMTPVEMVKRGTLSPAEAYAYAKAREDLELEDVRRTGGVLGTAAEMAGNIGSGAALLRGGVSAIPAAMSRLGAFPGAVAGSAADAAALGALTGAAEGRGADRVPEALKGAATGAIVGGALPVAGAALGAVAAPVLSNIAARVNPQAYAQRQVGRAAAESRQAPEEVAQRLAAAAADAQPEYRLIDALDYPGRRLGAVVTKAPGEGRTELREFLNDRQGDQGRRVATTLAEGFDAPVAAQTAAEQMARARRAADDTAFSALRSDAVPVDVGPAVARINETLRPGAHRLANPDNGIAYDSVEATLSRARSLLTDDRSTLSDFAAVQRARGDVADAVEKAQRAGEGNKARLLRQVRNEMDAALEASSPGFRDAMARSRDAAREIDAIDTGRAAAGRGRTEPKILAFGQLRPPEQQAFRVGYVDSLIARAQNAAEGVNAVRPLTSLSARTELPAFAVPGLGEQMMRRLGREGEMFATRAEALGNSKTAENLADSGGAALDTTLLRRVLSGDVYGALREGFAQASAVAGGNTAPVRAEIARILTSGNPDEVRALLESVAAAQARRGEIGQNVARGITSAAVPALERATIERQRRGQR